MSPKKLYLVTGKGGVGKTITAMAVATLLKTKYPNKKVYYNNFGIKANEPLAKDLGVEALNFDLDFSARVYISRKLKSRTIATWIMKTPFFKALFNIVPSLGNMITLGHIIDHLENNSDDILVVDAPSSGHLMTVLESPKTFEKIFKSGPIVNDIRRMISFIGNPNFVKLYLVSIPTELAVTEGLELSRDLKAQNINNQTLILNNIFSYEIAEEDKLPIFLQKKVTNEREIIQGNKSNFDLFIPMITEIEQKEIIRKLVELLKDKIDD